MLVRTVLRGYTPKIGREGQIACHYESEYDSGGIGTPGVFRLGYVFGRGVYALWHIGRKAYTTFVIVCRKAYIRTIPHCHMTI